jgi:hypothetical protein
MAVEFSEHALEGMAERQIARDRIDDALDVGSRFWDREQKSLVVFERMSLLMRRGHLQPST